MYVFEYAPTGRAKCMECGVCIDKGDIRMCSEEKFSSHSASRFLHLNCWKVPENVASLKGFSLDKLSVADQQKIVEYINENKPKEEKKSNSLAPRSGSSKKVANSEPKTEPMDTKRKDEGKKQPPTRASKRQKKIDDEQAQSTDSPAQAESKTAASAQKSENASGGSDSSSDSDHEENELVLKPLTEAVKQQRKQQEKMIEAEMSKISNFTVEQLKSELRKNDQSTSGTKFVLLSRVADGRVRGSIPRCPKCAGGRLRMNAKELVYHYTCPGFHDDEEFQHW
eukprot:TRINITY_DN2763_c0_g1_i5.p1 TRINITY_DN2763_c0_g1~~TRINITY_DN2763_c0_g1_i5.p1  ORF type:complete len:282 (-),score=62.74 TRINITY_DN2763_c0_g1_i5:768-1613(-)